MYDNILYKIFTVEYTAKVEIFGTPVWPRIVRYTKLK